MAKVNKAKIKKGKKGKRSTPLPPDDPRWRPAAEIVKRLLPHVGSKILIAHDLTEALASGQIRCMRRYANEHELKYDKLTDAELQAIAGRKVVELEHDQVAGRRKSVRPSFWNRYRYARSPNGDIRVGFRLPPNNHGHSELSFILTANWTFYLWEPDCVKAWPALTPQDIGARRAKPRRPRTRLTQKPSRRVDPGPAIEGRDSAAASGSPNTIEPGDTVAIADPRKRKRAGKLSAEQISAGFAYLRDHPKLKPKQAYPGLRRKLNTDVSDTTLWRAFWKKNSK